MTVKAEEFFDWLGEHGVDHRNVCHVEFVPAGVASSTVFMKVSRFALSDDGKRFLDPTSKDVATETIWVQLRSLPTDPVVLRAEMAS